MLHFPPDESYVRVRVFIHVYKTGIYSDKETFLSTKNNNAYLIDEMNNKNNSIPRGENPSADVITDVRLCEVKM